MLVRREVHLHHHPGELLEADEAVAVLVVLLEHGVDLLLVDVVVAPVLAVGLVQRRGRRLLVLRRQVPSQPPSHLRDEVLGGEAGRAAHVPRALPVPERVVQGLAERRREVEDLVPHGDLALVAGVALDVERRRVLERPDHRLDESQRVQGRFFTRQVVVPQVADGPVRRLELLDERPVVVLAHQVARDETGGAVDLGNFVRHWGRGKINNNNNHKENAMT